MNYLIIGISLLVVAALIIAILVFMIISLRKKNSALEIQLSKVNATLKETEETVLQTQRKLTEAEQFRFQMLNIAAHELKNPLVAVVNFGELLSEPDLTPSERYVILTQATGMAERALMLINSLLEAHQLNVGQIRAEIGIVSLLPILHHIVLHYRTLAKHKSIIIFNEYPLPANAEIRVKADETMLKQVIDNIISNAVKFTGFNKSIFVNVEIAETDKFQESNLPSNRQILSMAARKASTNRVRITVKDEGPGVSKNDMSEMFGMFTKLSARPTGGENSTGVGLSIAKRLTETMHGRIWCESELGSGSTFIIELPLEDA